MDVRRRRRWRPYAALVGVAAALVVAVWFQPQKLFIDDRVAERLPAQPADAEASEPPRDLARAEFVSRSHPTSGAVRIVELNDGRRFVRLDDLRTDNGPALYVYLSTNPVDGVTASFDDDFVDLGRLKGNLGDQNYELPPGVDLRRFRSLVVWCDRFDVAFGAAALDVSTG